MAISIYFQKFFSLLEKNMFLYHFWKFQHSSYNNAIGMVLMH